MTCDVTPDVPLEVKARQDGFNGNQLTIGDKIRPRGAHYFIKCGSNFALDVELEGIPGKDLVNPRKNTIGKPFLIRP